MLSQFTSEGNKRVLADLGEFPRGVYPVGRLDADSEGLLLLTDDSRINHRLLHPSFSHQRTYLVQVEGNIDENACLNLVSGISITVDGKKHLAKALNAVPVNPPEWLPQRVPPVRFRKTVPDSWMELTLSEGKNRQVRKMTAAAGFPTLRLIRISIEGISLAGMQPGEVKKLDRAEWYRLLKLIGSH